MVKPDDMAGAPPLHMGIDPEPAAPGRVRRTIEQQFACLGDAMPSAQLVASELVTNAVRHGAPPIRFRAELREATMYLEVHDGTPVMGRKAADSRGLDVVDQLATNWGYRPEGAGKCVWAEVPRRGGTRRA